jgi:predicted neuraminidase
MHSVGFSRFLAVCAVLGSVLAAAQEESPVQPLPIVSPDALIAKGAVAEFVFEDDRPFAQCHASTLVETPSGDLLCAWFAGTQEKHPDVGIWMSRRSGEGWSAPALAVKISEAAHWNPVLFRDDEEVLYLFFKMGPEIPFWQTYWMRSTDDGVSWSEPVELVSGDKGGRGPVRSKPVVLSDGSWLAGASTEQGPWKPFADRSEDQGQTWTRSEDWVVDPVEFTGKGAIQPTLWESAPGQVHALLRTTGGVVGRVDSSDYGRTWSALYRTSLPNNNSGVDVVDLEDGRLVLVYNPVAGNWAARTPLNLAVSTDNGASWRDIASLESEMATESERRPEFSYPAIVRTRDGVAVSYTWKRQRVRVWRIPLGALNQD